MEKATLGCRCSHARETLHAVCPKLLKFLFVLRSAYRRHWCSSARNKTIPHSMQKKILGSKACLLHDCPLLSLERLSLGNSELPKSCQTRYGIFCNRPALHTKDHSGQQSMPSAWLSLAIFGKVVSPIPRWQKKNRPNFIRSFQWILQLGASPQLAQTSYPQMSYPQRSYPILSTAGPWNMPPCSRQ